MKLAALLLLTIGCAADTGAESSSLTHAPGACGDVETHIIGVMQPTSSQGELVILRRKGHHALVLSAHDATSWHVKLENGAVLDHVYAVGYGKQTVDVAGVQVMTDDEADTGVYACGFSWADDSDGCSTQSLMILASKRVHHDITSFHGCRTASRWEIGEDMATTSDCAEPQSDWAGGCSPDSTGTCGNGGGSDSGPPLL